MNRKTIFLLILIILVGTFLRVHDLGTESFWTDEAMTFQEITAGSLAEGISILANKEGIPPGYTVFLYYWGQLFGHSEFSLRFPSVIAGMAAVVFTFLLGRLLFSEKVALIAALLSSTAMLQIVYSQEARLYSIYGLLVLASVYFFILAFVKGGTRKTWWAYIITTVLALWVNYLMLGIIFLQGVVVIGKKLSWKKWLLSIFVFFLAFLPLINILLNQTILRHQAQLGALPRFGIPTFLAKFGLAFYALPFLTFILFFSIFLFFPKFKKYFKPYMVVVFFVLIGIVYFLSLETLARSFSLVRHSYFLVPVLYFLMAKTITSFKSVKIKSVVIILILVFNIFALSFYYTNTTKPDWKNAADYINKETEGIPTLLFTRSGTNVFLFSHYFSKEFNEITLPLTYKDEEINEGFTNAIKLNKEMWVISSRDEGLSEVAEEALSKKYLIKSKKEFPGVSIVKYSS